MQVNLGGLDRSMTEVLLHDPEVLGSPVQLTRIAVPDLMRRDAGRSVVPEDMLDSPG
jgi:hypothetical protein